MEILRKEAKMKKLIFLGMAIGILMSVFLSQAMPEGLTGAGATFPYPLYSKMFSEYYKKTGVKINYQAIGSGGGIRQLRAKLVDFGASDAYVDDEGFKKFSAPILHIPTAAGAVVLTYNLQGNPKLKLTGKIISDIFLGKITNWNAPEIKKLNPEVKLPDLKIIVVHRSDGSGTTFIFSDYLCKVSKEWKNKIGRGKSLNWPCGLGAKGNPGVAGLIKQISGSIGYVELIYALSNKMPYADVQNKSGNFITPGIKSVSLAADTKLPDDMRVSLTDTDAEYGYPISGFTWILVYKDLKKGGLTEEKARDLVKLLWWMIHKGQKYAEKLHYAPLSEKAVKKAERIIKSITYGGNLLWR